MYLRLLAFGLAALIAAGCSQPGPDAAEPGSGGSTSPSTTEPSAAADTTTSDGPGPVGARSPEELGITLDPSGRPYDMAAEGLLPLFAETELVTQFEVVDGQLRVMDGNGIQVDPVSFADEAVDVDFGEHTKLDLSVVWASVRYGDGKIGRGIIFVRLDVPQASVQRWEPFEYAYATDGGTGGFTSAAVLERGQARRTGSFDDWLFEWDAATPYYVGDHVGGPAPDTFVFSNGYGDGAFPMTRGLSSEGELASLLLWHPGFPWRIAVLDGTPPRDVTEREQQLIDCMDGRRPVDDHGYCEEK